MELWTWHEPDFSLLSGRVEHNRSEYYQRVPGIVAAYDELWHRLKNDGQLVWCCTDISEHGDLESSPHVLWKLDVPPDQILGFVDEIVWNRILGFRCSCQSLRYSWQSRAIEACCADRKPLDTELLTSMAQQYEDEFWNASPPGGSWWNALFLEPQAKPLVSALIRHPVPLEWVTENPNRTPHAISASTTLPCTSVSRKSRPA